MGYKNFCTGGGWRSSPVFCRDIEILEHNGQHLDTSLIIAGTRCRFGHVQTLTCRPFSRKGKLFPTTFWLTCPYLTKLAGMTEAKHGVHDLESYIKSHDLSERWHEYNTLHQLIRINLVDRNLRAFTRKYKPSVFRSLIRGGIGGIKYTSREINVKCLHLQTASFISLGSHPAGEWLESHGLYGNCEKCLCRG